MRGLWAALTAAAAMAGSPLLCHGGSVAVTLRPAFGGEFRPGWPVWVWVSVANDGPAFHGALDLIVEGVTYRRPLRVGERTTGLSDALVVARSEAVRARVVVRANNGAVLHEAVSGLGLRRRGKEQGTLVVSVGVGVEAGKRLFGDCHLAVGAEELPTAPAGYAPVGALAIEGDGVGVETAAKEAVANWVRGGGVVGFLLEAGAPVRSDSLLAELGGCAGRTSAEEWLRVVGERQATRGDEAGRQWRVGRGEVVVGLRGRQAGGAFAHLLEGRTSGDEWADAGLYSVFTGARWSAALRWRLVGAAAALLAVGVVAGRVGLRARRRVAGWVCVASVAALLGCVAWWVMLPGGRGWQECVCVAERVAGQAGERRTEVVCLEALGRTRTRLDFGLAEAVVPFLHSGEGSGSGGDCVVERDGAGRWRVDCELTRRTRRCFGAWWPWREGGDPERGVSAGDLLFRAGQFAVAGEPGGVPQGGWRPLDDLREWGAAHRALAAWMARRVEAGRVCRVVQEQPQPSAVESHGVLGRRCLAAQVWTKLGD